MNLVIEFGECLCYASVFTIDGKEAEADDFVDKYDHSPETAEEYSCGDMRCDIRPCRPEILEKYGITEKEYALISEKLSDGLSFGSCGWCS